MRYVGCLAPSPAGLLHLGHAATFLTAAARAGAAAGTLLMRLDDLDRQRSRDAFAEAALEDLRWLGLAWTGVVRQSERLPLYRDALGKLLAMGSAYPCVCSRRDLQQATDAPHEDANDEPLYPGHCRPMAGALRTLALQAGMNYRFRVPDGQQVPFTDGNFGPQHFLAGVDFGDFLVWRRDALPSYQLACVVDDAAMGFTEVVRGRDLLKSTARQLLLQRALGLPVPVYWHTAPLRNAEGERLAKRHDALSLRALRESGWRAEAVRLL